MIYTEGKILIRVNGNVVIVKATTPEDDVLEWEKEMGDCRQWIMFKNDPYKCYVHPRQVIEKYDPLKPIKHFKNKKAFNI